MITPSTALAAFNGYSPQRYSRANVKAQRRGLASGASAGYAFYVLLLQLLIIQTLWVPACMLSYQQTNTLGFGVLRYLGFFLGPFTSVLSERCIAGTVEERGDFLLPN